jgi:hypothetical protein
MSRVRTRSDRPCRDDLFFSLRSAWFFEILPTCFHRKEMPAMRVVMPLTIVATALFATGIAVAASRHVMNVPLADGGVARVEYEGDVAPRVTVVPAAQSSGAPVAIADPFAEMDSMFAAMERRNDAMMREVAAMQAQAGADPSSPVRQVSAGDGAPAGGNYSFVSTTTTSSGGCGHSVEVTQQPGAAPRRIERSFGDCSGAHAAPAPRAPNPPTPPAPAEPTT